MIYWNVILSLEENFYKRLVTVIDADKREARSPYEHIWAAN